MAFKQTIKYMREINKIPKTWKHAMRLWRIKKDSRYANEYVFFHKGNFYYRGVLLQVREGRKYDGRAQTTYNFYYKKVTYLIEDY